MRAKLWGTDRRQERYSIICGTKHLYSWCRHLKLQSAKPRYVQVSGTIQNQVTLYIDIKVRPVNQPHHANSGKVKTKKRPTRHGDYRKCGGPRHMSNIVIVLPKHDRILGYRKTHWGSCVSSFSNCRQNTKKPWMTLLYLANWSYMGLSSIRTDPRVMKDSKSDCSDTMEFTDIKDWHLKCVCTFSEFFWNVE